MQKQLNVEDFGPNAQASVGSGNKEAQLAADRAKAALDAIPVDADALLLAERNAVLDFALDKFQDGKNWLSGILVSGLEDYENMEYYPDKFGALARAGGRNAQFCAMGALGAAYGPFSRDALQAAVFALSDHIKETGDVDGYRFLDAVYDGKGYGYLEGSRVFNFNDRHQDGNHAPVLAAFRAAKSQPLRRP